MQSLDREKENAEEALEKSDENYKTLVETSNDMIFTVNLKGNFLFANKAFEKNLGYSVEEIKKINGFELVHPEDLTLVKKQFTQLVKGKSVNNMEYRYRCKDNSYIHILNNATPLLDVHGKTIAAFGIARDITEVKCMEERRARAVVTASVIDAMADGLALVDMSGKIISVNPALEKMTGYGKKDLAGQNVVNLMQKMIKQEEIEKVIRSLQNALKGKPPCPVVFALVSKSGKEIPTVVTGSFIKDAEGKLTALIAIFRDITELKLAEKALKESEERYRSVVENANDGIYIIAPEGFEYVNPAFEELVGYTLKRICSKHFNFWNIIHPDDRKLIKEREEARKKGKKIPTRYEFRIIAKNGKTKIVEATTVNIGKKGEIKVMGILRDITKRIKAEEEMKRALEQEREFKLRAAHYFFNPLCIAKGYLDLMTDEIGGKEKERLETIRGAIGRVENVVKNVVLTGEIRE